MDRTATRQATGNRAFSARTKHVAPRFSYICELVKDVEIEVNYTSISKYLGDIGTKFVSKQRDRYLIDQIKDHRDVSIKTDLCLFKIHQHVIISTKWQLRVIQAPKAVVNKQTIYKIVNGEGLNGYQSM